VERHFSPYKIFHAVIRRFPLIVVAAIISFFVSTLITNPNTPDVYAASSTVYSASYASYRESVEGINAMKDYIDIVTSRKVAERAASYIPVELSPFEIMGMTSVAYSSSSTIITIQAMSTDPELAVSVSNAVSEAFTQEVQNITAVETVKILDGAREAILVVDGYLTAIRNRVLITAVGTAAMVLLIAIITIFDSSVATPVEVTLNGELVLLGFIPDNKKI